MVVRPLSIHGTICCTVTSVVTAARQVAKSLGRFDGVEAPSCVVLDQVQGLKRRMRLMQESRTFLVTKKAFDEGTCRYVPLYSNSKVNAPRKVRNDSWVLEP
ncbi:hypothetical protein GCM10009798_09540 [Nocardioides panacihumi]|uniref:Uncharacterized protein n=1 Tax=Nocardioides panacihumi TaxID=400774 RepID=A0ABP5BTS7_9ACTN